MKLGAASKHAAKDRLKKIMKDYNRQTNEITDEAAMAMLNTDKGNDYLSLLAIANHAYKGKPRAILLAYKLGFLKARSTCSQCEYTQEFQSLTTEVTLKLRKAAAALRTAGKNFRADGKNPAYDNTVACDSNAADIYDLVGIAEDYVCEAQEELKGGILL